MKETHEIPQLRSKRTIERGKRGFSAEGTTTMRRPDDRSRKQQKKGPFCPSSRAIPAADQVSGASVAATTSVDLLQETAPRGPPLTCAPVDQPHLDCPRCGSADTRFKWRSREKPRYICSSCRRGWTRGAALRPWKKKQPHTPSAAAPPPPPLLAPPTTPQPSHAAVSPAPVAAGFSVEPSSQRDGLECSLGSAFMDWIDQFLQTRMQEDFRAAFCCGSEDTDGRARSPSPPAGDQEPEHKLQQQKQEQLPPLPGNGGKGLF